MSHLKYFLDSLTDHATDTPGDAVEVEEPILPILFSNQGRQ